MEKMEFPRKNASYKARRRKILVSLMVLFMISVVTVGAAWLFSISSSFNADVLSQPGYLEIVVDFNNLEINTTEYADSNNTVAEFIINKDAELLFNVAETFQDNSGGACLDGINDCTLGYEISTINGVENISNGATFNVPSSGNKYINVTLSCEAYSCPQSRGVDIILTEVVA